MNILLVNPNFPYSFWSLDQSLRLLNKKALLPPLGLITVAAILPQEWNFKLVDQQFQEVTEDMWNWAETILLTGMIVQKKDQLLLIKEAKSRNKRVVVGGPYVSSVPDGALAAGADIVVRGELEPLREELLHALNSGATGLTIEKSDREDLHESPIPRFDLLDMDSYVAMGVQTSRGCPFECEFCDIVHLFGRKTRYKNPVQITNEMERLFELGWNRTIFICDDNFIGSRSKSKAILDQLIPWMKEHNEPFGFLTQASVNLGQDQEMMDLLTEANFSEVFVGIESPDESTLERTKKRQNITNPLVESMKNLCANGLTVIGSFVVGFDGEEKGVDSRIRDFIEETNIPSAMLNILAALPNTKLSERLEREGRLLFKDPDGELGPDVMNFTPTRPKSEIFSEYRNTIDWLYEPRAYIERSYRYFSAMRPTRKALGLPRQYPIAAKYKKLKNNNDDMEKIKGLFRLLWKHGIRAPYRLIFWKNLIGMYRRNPSRLVKYLEAIGFGENMFRLREIYLAENGDDIYHSHPTYTAGCNDSSDAVGKDKIAKSA